MTIRPRHVLAALPILLATWIAVLALVLRLGGDAPAALVVLPPAGLLGRLPPGVSVTDANALGLVIRVSQERGDGGLVDGGPGDGGLIAALYEAGAALVLPAGLAGCLALDGSGWPAPMPR